MEIVALTTIPIGSALGLRFRVLVLLPAILLCVLVITLWQMSHGASVASIALMDIVGTICLQFGYLGGALIGSMSVAGRVGAKSSPGPFAH